MHRLEVLIWRTIDLAVLCLMGAGCYFAVRCFLNHVSIH